ncbi:EAL domain-containing protein [Pseudomonas sp. Fl5BN2]|uniref:EAL domain-containing protein n=1 Tax=unclassified Pseudomonas TaxID=196821 RepID=UPI0013777226|nr:MULTISPECIES: EAL domain-containing protein [unclassified Pseudomonas]NBF02186.1 EAL domain-containing protein [Pseudomonas sp. Fl5BN2]NBF07875.1 EAL domain-containing protein [Pseudomonas sp. Fl4BN1]
MPLNLNSLQKRQHRYWVVLVSGLLPILLGSVILYMQAELTLEKITDKTTQEAVRELDLMLDNAAHVAHQILPLAGHACDAPTRLILRELVTRQPFVRSSNLVWRNSNYCSSLFGSDRVVELNPSNYVDGQLWLLNSKQATTDRSVLIYRVSLGEQSALTRVNGYHLTNALRLISRDRPLILQVGRNWLSVDGQVQQTAVPAPAVAPNRRASTRYPYSIQASMPEGEVWRYMISHYPALFCLLVFFGLLAAGIGHRLQKRSSAPTHELQRALEANEFIPYLQPVVRSDNAEWAGAEVLMRWQHPKEGLVRPDLFIPLAEDCGLIVLMTRSLLRQTASLLASHTRLLKPGFHIAVNITARHCQDMDLLQDCREFLGAFPPGHVTLVLELTERELIEPTEVTHKLFQELHELGVMIAIDDFGTGHSSLSYLRNLNVDYLKIDKSFVAMIGVDALSRHILDSIIELSAKLDLRVVAEGVETKQQRDYLAEHGVEFLQGYLFGRPVSGDAFVSILRGDERDRAASK